MTDQLALRTRLFGAVLQRISKPADTAEEMIALRKKRARLLASPVGRLVTGRESTRVAVEERAVALAHHDSRMRIHTPPGAGPKPVVVNFHGGGWCIGTPEQSGWFASHVAELTGAIVVSPTYRLAPEHPYPAATDDAWAAFEWVRAHAAELGGDPRRMAVTGDSAGGNLASVVALLARDAGIDDIRAQALVYPAVEIHERWPSEDEFAEGIVLTSRGMRTFSRLYAGDTSVATDWQLSPIRAASHAGLPPALIVTAHHDPLRDHGERYAAALAAAGVEVELRDYGPGVHGFLSLPRVVPVAKDALADVAGFLSARLS
ncbi:MAG TPA: alpha/beta hydrolase [Nocardioides sp.]|uniref:alpha/beta hydrolase n=1 Tax=Nocardioides sp. TaxID=35761 RepID=UPI002ED8A79D